MICPYCGAEISTTSSYCANCGSPLASGENGFGDDRLTRAGLASPAPPPEWAVPKSKRYSETDLWLRYFAHGAVFSLLTLFLAIVWIIVSIPLVLCGAFIGLGMALILLVLMIGYLNIFITQLVWGVATDLRWKAVLVHGLFMILVLIIASIPSMLIRMTTTDVIVAVVLFLAYCFVDGVIGRWVANMFLMDRKDEMALPWEG